MNSFRKLMLSLSISLLSVTSAAADTDYTGIRKDLNVMNKIVAVAIDSADNCEKCRVSIKGSYLAKQGAIFVVSPRRGSFHEMIISDGDYAIEGLAGLERLEALEGLEGLEGLHAMESLEGLPEMIGEIVADVNIAVGGISVDSTDVDDHEVRITRQKLISDENRDIERQLRSLQRQMMRLNEDMHDKEIEAMRAEASARGQLEAKIGELESEMSTLEMEQEQLRKQLSDARQKRIQQREKIRAEAAVRKQEMNSRIENIVVTAFCDYGASLKNVPEDEKVSILFENEGSQWGAEKNKIYVLGKSDLSACQEGKINRDAMVANATVYQF